MKRVPVWIVLLSLFLAPAAAEIVRLDRASLERSGVLVEQVESAPFGDRVRVVGQVVRAPGSTNTIKSILDGRIEEIHVSPGDLVRRGDRLLSLHSHSLHELQGNLLRNAEALKLADTRVEAGRQLLELEGIARIELQRREHQALAARLELRAVRTELEDLGYSDEEIDATILSGAAHPVLVLRAPAAGVVLSVAAQSHEWIRAYDPLAVVGNPASLELQLQLAPDEAGRVSAGDTVEFIAVGRPGSPGRARVVSRVPQVDPRTRTVTIRAEIVEAFDWLLPGIFVEGTLILGTPEIGSSVPEGAVIRLDNADHLFVRLAEGEFEARTVHLGRYEGGRYEVLDGVSVGEEVAVHGVFLLKSALIRGEGAE